MSFEPDLNVSRYIRNPGPKAAVRGLKAACSTDNAIVTETILNILAGGGNAVDACVAGCMVQAAVEPYMTNHAGSVSVLYYEAATGALHQLDSIGFFPSGLAPMRSIPQMPGGYAASPPAACIPGFMPGLKALHARFSTMGWSRLCADAIRWAEEGHPVSTFEAHVNAYGEDFITYFPEGRNLYLQNGFFPNVGEIFANKPLAETLRRVAEDPDHMITGAWADRFISKANAMGWPITKAHMTETPPRWIDPLRIPHNEFEIIGLGAPQGQGLFIAMVLGILRHLDIRKVEPGSAEHVFYMAHALRFGLYHLGFAGDTQVVADYAVQQLLDDDFHRAAAKLIKGLRPKVDLSEHVKLTSRPGGPNAGIPGGASAEDRQHSGSCEISIVDQNGNWLQMMNTLQSGGIPGQVIDGVPMIGSHASFHQVGARAVTLTPGARMRGVMGNTLVFKDGKPVLSLGTPGNVYCTVPQVLTYILDFKLDPYAAADAPRMLPLAEDNSVIVEDRLSAETVKKVQSMGMTVRAAQPYDFHMGSFQMCFRDPKTGELGATADPRRCGVADGLR